MKSLLRYNATTLEVVHVYDVLVLLFCTLILVVPIQAVAAKRLGCLFYTIETLRIGKSCQNYPQPETNETSTPMTRVSWLWLAYIIMTTSKEKSSKF